MYSTDSRSRREKVRDRVQDGAGPNCSDKWGANHP